MIREYLEYGTDKYNAMVEEVRKELRLNSLKYQSLDKLFEASGVDPWKVCTLFWS